MFICNLCDSPYVISTGESWNGKCPTCGKFIGHELYRFSYYKKTDMVSNLFGFYVPDETYYSLELSQNKNDESKIYISYEDDSAMYYSESYESIKYFFSGWLYARSYLTGQAGYRNKFITHEGIMQEN